MKKTKKALLAALACSAVLAGAFGLAACGGGSDDSGDSGDTPHSHSYTYTANNDGTHDGTCANTDGKCDAVNVVDEECDTDGTDGACSKCHVKAEADDPTKIKVGKKTIASLDDVGVTLMCEGLEAGKTYTVSCDNPAVLFQVGIEWDANPATFEYGLMANMISVYTATEGLTLTNVRIKLEEVKEEEVEYPTIELNEDVTVTGADQFNPVNYQIELEAGRYQILIDGEVLEELEYSSEVQFGDSFDSDGYVNLASLDIEHVLNISAAGTYYLQAIDNVTFKVVVAPEHTHDFNTAVWESDGVGHWHPTDCLLHPDDKGDYDEHHFGEASEADEDGIKIKTCNDCGYEESDISGLTATSVTGGTVQMGGWDATPVTAGTYKTTIAAQAGLGSGYNPGVYYFGITSGSTAKAYTIKVLTKNTAIVNATGETILNEVGADEYNHPYEYRVVLRANRTFEFGVTTKDYACEADYSCDVAFKITESDDPVFEGTVELPVIVKEGANKKTVNAANTMLFYVIESSNGFGELTGDLKITFEGITVKYLGSDISNQSDGTTLVSGDVIPDNAYADSDVYLFITTSNSGEFTFNVESVIAEGKKGNPIAATFGTDNANQVTLDPENDVYVQWFKVTAAEKGLFVVKSEAAGADFEVYNSTDDDRAFLTGSRVTLDLEADETVYIRATSMEGTAYAFTVTEATEADKGYSASYAIEITESGSYNIPKDLVGSYGVAFFTYEAKANCTVTIEHTGAEYACFIYVNVDEYEEYGGTPNASSPVTINAEAGHTYILACYPELLTDGTLTVTITPAATEEA